MLWLFPTTALALGLRFPTSDADYGHFYPTAYFDHGGVDWACGDKTYGGHAGSDFGIGGFDGMALGIDVVAAAAGTVLSTSDGAWDECTTKDCDGGDGGGYGNHVWLQHGDGSQTIYAHLSQWSVAVSPGDTVACGAPLGLVGSSGYSSGPHLHFELREADGATRRDPFQGDCGASPTSWVDQGVYEGVPAPVCDDAAPCSTAATLTCGDVVQARNDAVSADSQHGYYGCSGWTYTGPEIAWEVVTDIDELVTVQLSGLSDDLDLYALDDAACDTTGCLASSDQSDASDEQVEWEATAGHAYVVVVDGYQGAVSDLTLTVRCEGGLPGGDTGADADGGSTGTADGGATGSGHTEDTNGTQGRPGELVDPADLGGCSVGGTAASALWLGALLGTLRRRASYGEPSPSRRTRRGHGRPGR